MQNLPACLPAAGHTNGAWAPEGLLVAGMGQQLNGGTWKSLPALWGRKVVGSGGKLPPELTGNGGRHGRKQ